MGAVLAAWRDDELKMILGHDKKGIENDHHKLGKQHTKTGADMDENDVRGQAGQAGHR